MFTPDPLDGKCFRHLLAKRENGVLWGLPEWPLRPHRWADPRRCEDFPTGEAGVGGECVRRTTPPGSPEGRGSPATLSPGTRGRAEADRTAGLPPRCGGPPAPNGRRFLSVRLRSDFADTSHTGKSFPVERERDRPGASVSRFGRGRDLRALLEDLSRGHARGLGFPACGKKRDQRSGGVSAAAYRGPHDRSGYGSSVPNR